MTVQNHKNGTVNTVGTYWVAYGTTVSQLVSDNSSDQKKGNLQENNMYYAIGEYGKAALGGSWGSCKFTQNTIVQQVCYVWIYRSDVTKPTEGWVYCGESITKTNFNFVNNAFDIFDGNGNLLKSGNFGQ